MYCPYWGCILASGPEWQLLYGILGVYKDNGKENGNHYIWYIGLYKGIL